MMELQFEGYFQCRLATNPDPTDELRGVSGYTFALAGEPDLDRIIRFQTPIAVRSHGPRVGVRVTTVAIDGERRADHVLVEAAVDLLNHPRFESRNVILSDDRGGVGVIHPFVVQISKQGVSLRREDLFDCQQPDLPLHQISPMTLNRRAPRQLDGMVYEPERVAALVGVEDAVAFRSARRLALERDREAVENSILAAALDKRIRELSNSDPRNIRTVILNVGQDRRFDINGPTEIIDREDQLGVQCDTERDWPIEFWMGAWDADALCGFVKGKLSIPTRSLPKMLH